MLKWLYGTGTILVAALAGGAAAAADLPSATQEALADLNLDASVLEGLDSELDVPQAWVDGAASESGVTILGTWRASQFTDMAAPFVERYPNVELNYTRAGTAARGMRVLVALKEGRALGDVVTSFADVGPQFAEMKALADLRELPSFDSLSTDHTADDGTWASFKLSYRCMGYNTNLVKESDLPETWDDLLTNPVWRDGNLAVSNHVNAWVLPLWGAKGEEWGRTFLDGLFETVQPQQRKEGMSALTALTVAGEFHANIPAPEWRVEQHAEKGAPIGYHCPSPVPITLSQIGILKLAPNKNSARLFVNWLLSKEGQVMQYVKADSVPVHKGLQMRRFVPFTDTIVGKPAAVRDDDLIGSPMHERLVESWETRWTAF